MLTIIFPVLNERLRLESGITRTVEYLEKIEFDDYEIISMSDGEKLERWVSFIYLDQILRLYGKKV